MNKVLIMLIAIVLIAASGLTNAALVREIEKGYEVNELKVVMTSETEGRVIARECDGCREETLLITARTRVFKDNEEIPLKLLMRYRGQAGVVFRHIDTDEVTRIRIY